MFWDYHRARLTLIIGVLFGVLVFILLLLYSDNMWAIISFMPLYLIALRSYVRKVSMKTMHDLEKSLYKDLDVLDYAETYDHLAKNGVRFDERWTVTKHQYALLGNLFLGDQRKAEDHISYLEENHEDFYKDNPLFKYLFDVLKTLYALFYESLRAFKQALKVMDTSFAKLPEEVQKQIKENEDSLHNWIHWNEKNILEAPDKNDENLLKAIKQMPKLNGVGSYYLLKKENPDVNDAALEKDMMNVFNAGSSEAS